MTEAQKTVTEDDVIAIASSAAKAVAYHVGSGEVAAWLVGGKDENNVSVFSQGELDQVAQSVLALGDFVRANPLAPPEALWIFAAGRGFHRFPSTSFMDQPFWLRQCYRVFRDTLVSLDQAVAEERARLATAQAQDSPPPLAAALLADPRDTILELQPDPLAVRSDAVLAVVPPALEPVPAPADEPAPEPMPAPVDEPTPEPASEPGDEGKSIAEVDAPPVKPKRKA